MSRHITRSADDIGVMSPRIFAAIVGGIAIIVALIFLANSTSAEYDSEMFGQVTIDCGTVFSPRDDRSGAPAEACADALSSRKAWTIPLGVVGLVVLAGAMVIQTGPARGARQVGDTQQEGNP